jgi:hypothetical protein
MKITRSQLKRIIKEELSRITEAPDGIVPRDGVSQSAAQSAALYKRDKNDPSYFYDFMKKLDTDQSSYSGKNFWDDEFELYLDVTHDSADDNSYNWPEVFQAIRSSENAGWKRGDGGIRPFPKATPVQLGQKFAGFARLNKDVFSSNTNLKDHALAKFFKENDQWIPGSAPGTEPQPD